MKTLPKRLQNMQGIAAVWVEYHDKGYSIKNIAIKNEVSEELILDILENYDDHRDRICGWEGEAI